MLSYDPEFEVWYEAVDRGHTARVDLNPNQSQYSKRVYLNPCRRQNATTPVFL